ncbi:PEP-CTERM sorting domain-containing protein [Aquabacterium sp.]|uniref:PEP-CTERM sorting domain-containing protein n=1 Tax=Aquabacterium sp. TaxID=1872578 RepID=UPI002CDC5DF6|nr:PEP-CTERM sorting domain-containing protein [Aquabacterium sp.]HSW08669.1 PEP-CTERM sorting domain-containing protein [Aquabacterium sp.]
MKLSYIGAALLALAAASGASATPVVSGLGAGQSFQQYSGTAPVGNGHVNTDNVLWFVDELAVNSLKSWFIFFDPSSSQAISATLVFDSPIVDVIIDRAGLFQSHGVYGVDIDQDGNFNDYQHAARTGLEGVQDGVVWTPGSQTLQLRWTAENPGDHIRVLTGASSLTALNVPEPASWGLAGVALAALVGARLRRRKS